MALAAIMEGPNFALSMLQRPLIGTILFANILCIRDTRLPPQGEITHNTPQKNKDRRRRGRLKLFFVDYELSNCTE